MGAAREHEVRLMGFVLAALAVLTTFLAIWVASAVSAKVHADAPKASVSPTGLAIEVVERG